MFMDWWMLLLLLIVAGVWAEWRYRIGVKIGVNAGVETALNEADKTLEEETNIRIMESRLLGAQSCIINFIKWKLIKIDEENESLVGHSDVKWVVSKDLIDVIKEHLQKVKDAD